MGTINSPPETLSKGYCVWLFSNTFEEKFDLDVIDLKLINPPGSCRDNLVIKTENGLVETFCKNQPRTKISVVGKKIEIKLASHSPQSSFKLNYKLGEWKFNNICHWTFKENGYGKFNFCLSLSFFFLLLILIEVAVLRKIWFIKSFT